MRTHLNNVGYDEPEQNECRMNKQPITVEWKGLHLGRDIEIGWKWPITGQECERPQPLQ